ncbi:MAG TPA: glycosyltransferase, partial [Spirochaetota bacterium]|nr:glycosyltransferase [Spirochaetota bacterium]
YGYNCYYYLYIFLRNKKKEIKKNSHFLKQFYLHFHSRHYPVVTTQLPVFNERYVALRLIDAVVKMDYPRDKHEIQILDDSTDETYNIIKEHIQKYRQQGYDIKHIHRTIRTDFKAGALQAGMLTARGEHLAIFDSDFIPPVDFLRNTIPYLMANPKVGFVQTRWGHLNRNSSFLTKAQSIGIDGHFIIEQSARSWGGLFLNFNGTGGVWRKQTINEAGGWQGDTLTEDMDLSYRAQLAGWHTKFLYEVICQAELPENMNDFKSQQFRWAKGSIQTAKKLLPAIFKSKNPLKKKIQSFLHLTHYSIHPLMVIMALASLPMILYFKLDLYFYLYLFFFILIIGASFAPSVMYITSQYKQYPNWVSRLLIIPFLIAIGVGIAVNNTNAVISALFGSKGDFIRTPKSGSTDKKKNKLKKNYILKLKPHFIIELFLAAYCLYSFYFYLYETKYIIGPFILLYGIGFLVSSILSIKHHLFST